MAIPGPPGKLNVCQFVAKSLNLRVYHSYGMPNAYMHMYVCNTTIHRIIFIAPMHKRQTVHTTKLQIPVYHDEILILVCFILMTPLTCADMHTYREH